MAICGTRKDFDLTICNVVFHASVLVNLKLNILDGATQTLVILTSIFVVIVVFWVVDVWNTLAEPSQEMDHSNP